MTDKSLNLFHDYVAECVYLCPEEEEPTLCTTLGHSKIYTPGAKANSQTVMVSAQINKNGAVVKVAILVELGIL